MDLKRRDLKKNAWREVNAMIRRESKEKGEVQIIGPKKRSVRVLEDPAFFFLSPFLLFFLFSLIFFPFDYATYLNAFVVGFVCLKV